MKNKNYYMNFVESDFDAYITKLAQDKCWGDGIVIQAISEIYARKVELYMQPKNSSSLFLKRAFYEEIPGSQDSLKLLYTTGHYNAIIKKYMRISRKFYYCK